MSELFYVAIVVLIAGTLQGFTGFGYGLFTMALLPFFLPIPTAAVLVSTSVAIISLYMVRRNWKYIDLKIIGYPLVANLIFVPLGVSLLNNLNEHVLRILLGVLLILNSLFFLIQRDREISIKPTAVNGFLTGAISGTLSGMFTIGGAPLVLYFIHAVKDRFTYKASLDSIFLISSLIRLIWLYRYGILTTGMGSILIVAVFAGILGTILGFRLLITANREVIKLAVYIFMGLAGLSLIFL